MKELIHKWISIKDYDIGVEIYRRYGSNSYLKKLFSGGKDHYNTEKLEQELLNLLATATEDVEEKQVLSSPDIPATNKAKSVSEETDAPAEIKTAIARRRLLYAETVVKKNRLYELYKSKAAQPDEARRIAFDTLDAWDEIRKLWELTNFYDKNRRIPSSLENNSDYQSWPTDLLQKRWNSNYKYLRKFYTSVNKLEQLKARHIECLQLETILRTRDAFIYDKLILPCPS